MLNAIAKMTTDAVGAVADTVESVLPLSGKGGDDHSEPADAETTRDQDTSKASKSDKKARKDQSEGPVSRPLEVASTVSQDLDIAVPESTDKQADKDAGPTFETTEKQATSEDKQEVVTHKDDVKVPAAPKQQKPSKAPTPAATTGDVSTSQSSSSIQQSLTAGGQPLPKVSKGKAKWMKSSTAWYPDRAGVMHAPGVYINRKPRSNYMNPMNKVDVVF